MLSIFSYIWTKCFFYKYQIQLIWLLHPPLRLIIEWAIPIVFLWSKDVIILPIKIINLVIILVIKTRVDGCSELSLVQPEDSKKVRNEHMWSHNINHSCCGVIINFGHALHFYNNVNGKWLLIDFCGGFLRCHYQGWTEKKTSNFLKNMSKVSIILKKNNI